MVVSLPRLLPALAVAAGLMLVVRMVHLTEAATQNLADIAPGAGAAAPAASGAASPPPSKPANATNEALAPPPTSSAKPAGSAGEAPPPAAKAPARPLLSFGDEGGNLTPTELEILQTLGERRQALETRAGELDRREALLKAAEARIEARLNELKALQASIESAMQKYDEQEEARRRSLVKIYETMKPKDAARVLERLELEVMVELIEGMKEQKVAPIIAEMDPGKAKQLTAELAKRRQPTKGS